MPGLPSGDVGTHGVTDMIEKRVRNLLQIEYEKRLLIYDKEQFAACFDYQQMLIAAGFSVYHYDDVEKMRYQYETEIRHEDIKCAIIVEDDIYVPSDMRRALHEVTISLGAVYPAMQKEYLEKYIGDIELIDFSYDIFVQQCLRKEETERFVELTSFSKDIIQRFISREDQKIKDTLSQPLSATEWTRIAKTNAKLEKYASMHGIQRDQASIDDAFISFIQESYQKLANTVSGKYPAILPKVIDRIAGGEKVALVVADGMSIFDFEVLSGHMGQYDYDYGATYALIPTITSVSRQSLLAGKYPQQLKNPFSLSGEESGFYAAGLEHGYSKQQLFYGRGYQADPGPLARFVAIIVNDIDDMVHGQKQGRVGMLHDVELWAKDGRFLELVDKLLNRGFKVFITADHGNTQCTGGGAIKKLGVETETKSKRMIVLKDFANISEELSERTFEYPGYYLDKQYQYRICKGKTSFDNKNETVMTHGGITLEEVIVPFVEVRGRKHG